MNHKLQALNNLASTSAHAAIRARPVAARPTIDGMWEKYAWFAFPAFGLCLVGIVASYIWDDEWVLWPTLFAVLACVVMVPLVIVRPLLAVLAALRPDPEHPGAD
jgi:hypothetical protein